MPVAETEIRASSHQPRRLKDSSTEMLVIFDLRPKMSLVLLLTLLSNLGRDAKDFCSTETFYAQCDVGHVILMTSGLYGRMRLGRCVKVDFGFIGCSTDVIDILDRHCSGRRECRLRIPDPEMDATKPCLNDLTRYLAATFDCIPVNTPEPYNCQSSLTAPVDVTVGYILGPPPVSSSTGVLGCPWRVTASEGQRINLTLYDFGEARLGAVQSSVTSSSDDAEPEWDALAAAAGQRKMPSASSSAVAVCHRYAVVADVMARTDIDICSSLVRFSHAYTSIGNSLEIRLLRRQVSSQLQQQVTVDGGTFVLRYELVGCPVLKLSSSYWVRTTDFEATVGCFTSGRTWRLECRTHNWIGEIGNCTDDGNRVPPIVSSNAQDGMMDVFTSLPAGLAVVIIVVLATFVGLGIAAVGLTIIRRHRQNPLFLSKSHHSSVITRRDQNSSMTGSQRSCDKLNKTFPSEDAILRGRFWTTCPSVASGDFGYCGCRAAETGGGAGSIFSGRHGDEFLYSLRPPSIAALGESGQNCGEYLVDDTNFQIVLDPPLEGAEREDGGGIDDPGYSFPSEMAARAARGTLFPGDDAKNAGHASLVACGAVNWSGINGADVENGTTSVGDCCTSTSGEAQLVHCKMGLVSTVDDSKDFDK